MFRVLSVCDLFHNNKVIKKKTKQKETKRKRERMTDIEKWGQRDILSSF